MRVIGQKFWMWMSLWMLAPFAKGVGVAQATTVRPERHTTSGQEPKKEDLRNRNKVTPLSPKKDGGTIATSTHNKDLSKVSPNTRLKTTSKISPNTALKNGNKSRQVWPKVDASKVAPNTPKKDGGKKPNPNPE
jgi:hypothetical protein